MLGLAGGKAVNLGELLRAGLPVPPGACVTTTCYERAIAEAGIDPLADPYAIRQQILSGPIPQDVGAVIQSVVRELGEHTPLAVRSSATAEDLPFASFAGQQDTFLDVVGVDATLEAVRRCWASLWNERAVVYRANNDVDQGGVRLAVVIQRLVPAAAAGVLFTADPLTGRRGDAVVEAHPGLGEAVVSGAVNPDHWRIDSATGRVLDGPTDGCLTAQQLQELTRLGRRIEHLFGVPQDVEFAFDAAGALFIVQSRAITTLYPLPAGAPSDQRDLHVYLSFNVAQGVFRPLTPMGIDAFRLVTTGVSSLFGAPRTTPILLEAGGRLFIDLTTPLRSPIWRRPVRFALSQGEARSGELIDALLSDPRLAPRTTRSRAVRPLVRALARTRLPLRILAALARPRAARGSVARLRRAIAEQQMPRASAPSLDRLTAAENLLVGWPRHIVPTVVPLLVGGLGSFALAHRLVDGEAAREDFDAVRRALPHNPTTEMDLALWHLASAVRNDPAARTAVRDGSPAELAAAFRQRSLPPGLQRGLAAFLAEYGHRAIAEIDLGVPRWSDDPTPLLGHLVNYLDLDHAAPSPEAQFAAAAAQAERALHALVGRADRRGRLRGLLVHALLRRGRALAGLREMPKFLIVLVLARARALMLTVGHDLVREGRLKQADDVFFLTFPETREALGGRDVFAVVEQRRERYADEMRRRHVPRLLLSDGTEPRPAAESANATADALRGTPASAGRATGRARVIVDPANARLAPGEILVAPSTDPGWTPLFLTAGGLVMEMGGAMSHGAVVAREYGIPAVVGVAHATERIEDGQTIAVDGSSGVVELRQSPATVGAS